MTTEITNLSTFEENPDNPQTVTDAAFADLVKSIRSLPQTLAVSRIAYVTDYISPRTGVSYVGRRIVIAGNKRLRALKLIAADGGLTADGGLSQLISPRGDVPAAWFFDLTPLGAEARRSWLIKSNVQTGEWDTQILKELYSEDELSALLGADALDALLASLPDTSPETGKTDPDQTPAAPTEPTSRRGALYRLGNHLLMCGDATASDDMATLMQGTHAQLLLTDPPYNVAYVGGTPDALTIENDCMDAGAFQDFLATAFENANAALAPGGAFYIWHADSEGYNFRMAAHRVGWQIRQVLIWVKNSLVLGRQDYQWQHEPCLYGWKDGAPHYFTAARDETTVIEDRPDLKAMKAPELREMLTNLLAAGTTPSTVIHANKPARSEDHPTMKPVSLIARLVRNSTQRAETVLDPFGGSGTTIIACEQLGRSCRMMELDPKYCDVIRRRWAEFRHGEGCDWKTLTPEAER